MNSGDTSSADLADTSRPADSAEIAKRRRPYTTYLNKAVLLHRLCVSSCREKMAGEITLSSDSGRTIRKWREEFGASQQELARRLGVTPSVISDYESGRRKSPGIVVVRRIIDGLLDIDQANGGTVIKRYNLAERSECIISIKEFKHSISVGDFVEAIEGKNLAKQVPLDRDIHGFTVIDSMKAITSLDSTDYLKIYGWSSERALIFIGVKFGRSPMIAIEPIRSSRPWSATISRSTSTTLQCVWRLWNRSP